MSPAFQFLFARHARFRNGLAIAVFLISAGWLTLTTRAQTPEPIDTIKIDTDLVNVNVGVASRGADIAPGHLEQKDFSISENGVPQKILFFTSNDAPFDLVLLLDLSGSTSEKMGLIRKSAKRFVDAARPSDRIAIFTFSAEIHPVANFTSDHTELKKRIDKMESPIGGTNFWDALRFVIEHVVNQSQAEHRRSAVIVMTDGVDNALPGVFGDGSVTSFEDLSAMVQRSDSIILPIYLDTEKEQNRHGFLKDAYVIAREQLVTLALESGNAIYQARKVKDLEGVYEQVIRDLSTVYSIGYRPNNSAHDGSWRTLSVQLIGHPDLTARARRGYFRK
jgi:VWFA-related protein